MATNKEKIGCLEAIRDFLKTPQITEILNEIISDYHYDEEIRDDMVESLGECM